MRWLAWALVLGCGSGETPRASSEPAPSTEARAAEATEEPAAAPEPEPPAATAEEVPEPEPPREVPEELRERHDALVAAIEADEDDVASICALVSLLRRAGMLSEASSRLADVEVLTRSAEWDTELPEGTLEACFYEGGRIAEAREDWNGARTEYWRAMRTPIERRRRIVRDAFVRAAKKEVETGCGEVSTLQLRAMLTVADDPVFRRCLRERESEEPTCEILHLDDSRHPGTSPDSFDEHVTVGDEGAAFGLIGTELYVISVIRGRKQVRLCGFDIPQDSRLQFPRVLQLGDTTLFGVHSTNVVPYTCECEEGEEGYPESPGDCRCEDVFDIRMVFTDRGELRLALIDDYSTTEGMGSVDWDEPMLRASMSTGQPVQGEILQMGRPLRLRTHVLVPAE